MSGVLCRFFGRRSPFGSLVESIVEQSSDCGTALWLGAYRLSEIREAGNSKVGKAKTDGRLGRLTPAELDGRLRALKDLAADKLRPALPENGK